MLIPNTRRSGKGIFPCSQNCLIRNKMLLHSNYWHCGSTRIRVTLVNGAHLKGSFENMLRSLISFLSAFNQNVNNYAVTFCPQITNFETFVPPRRRKRIDAGAEPRRTKSSITQLRYAKQQQIFYS
jgi:hypothetical protein